MFLYNIVNNNETVFLRPYFPTYKLACDAFNIKTIYHDLVIKMIGKLQKRFFKVIQ